MHQLQNPVKGILPKMKGGRVENNNLKQAEVKQGMFKGWLHKKERAKMQP